MLADMRPQRRVSSLHHIPRILTHRHTAKLRHAEHPGSQDRFLEEGEAGGPRSLELGCRLGRSSSAACHPMPARKAQSANDDLSPTSPTHNQTNKTPGKTTPKPTRSPEFVTRRFGALLGGVCAFWRAFKANRSLRPLSAPSWELFFGFWSAPQEREGRILRTAERKTALDRSGLGRGTTFLPI